MAVPNNRSLAAEHRRHDRLLVARFAAGDASGAQELEARDLVRRCSECAALAADITAISTSVAQLPATPRSRDFRLGGDEAARMRGSRLDRWLRTLTGSGWATVRPVAAVALSVGLVMSVVGVLPMVGAGAGPVPTFNEFAPGPQVPQQTTDNRTGSGGLLPSPEVDGVHPGGADITAVVPPAVNNMDNPYIQQSPAVEQQPGQSDLSQKSLPGAGPSLSDALLLVGLAVTLLALAVLALLFAARRRYYDPLLR